MSKFAFVQAASSNYLPGLVAFFNSLIETSHKDDVILCSFRLPQKFLDKLKELPYNVRVVEMKGEDQVQETAIERFRVAAELGKEYEAICLVEGDIFLTANVGTFFEAARRKIIIVGSNGMIVNLGIDYQKQYNLFLGVDNYPYSKIHTTVPIFLNSSDLDWFDDFYKRRMNARAFDDVFGLNLLGIKMGKDKRMIVMPPYKFCQIHHFGLKPSTRIIEKEGMLLSETEEEVAMIHGAWFLEGWYTGLMDPMWGYFKDNQLGELHKTRALESRELVLNRFLRLCYRGKIDLRDFVKVDWLEKKLSNISDYD